MTTTETQGLAVRNLEMLEHRTNSSRPESVRTMSSAQVHELKNRLTVIKGISQLLGRQVRRPVVERDRLEDRVNCLQNEVIRIEMLINEITKRDDSALNLQKHDLRSVAYSED